jgi:hypothetical protein
VLGQLQLAIAKSISEAVLGVLSSEKSLSAGTLVETVLDSLAQEQPLLPPPVAAAVGSLQQQQQGCVDVKMYSFLLQQLLKAADPIFLSKGVFRAGTKGILLFQACTIAGKKAPLFGEALRGDLHLALLSAQATAAEAVRGEEGGAPVYDDLLADVLGHFDVDTLNCIQDAQEVRAQQLLATAPGASNSTSSSSIDHGKSRGSKLQEVLALHAQLTPLLQLYGSVRVVVGDYILPSYHPAAVRLKQLTQWKWPSAAAGEEGEQLVEVKGASSLPLLLQRLRRACKGHPAALAALAATGSRRNLERLFMELLLPVVLDPKTGYTDDTAGGVDVLMEDDEDDENWRWQKQVPLLQGLLQKEVVSALGLEAQGRRYQAAISGEAIPGWDGVWSAFKLAQLQDFWAEVRPLDVLALFCTAIKCRVAVYVQLPTATKMKKHQQGKATRQQRAAAGVQQSAGGSCGNGGLASKGSPNGKQLQSGKKCKKRPASAAAADENGGNIRVDPSKHSKVEQSGKGSAQQQLSESLLGADSRSGAQRAGSEKIAASAAGSSSTGLRGSPGPGCSPWVLLTPPGVSDEQLEGQLVLHVDAGDPQQQLQYTLVMGERLQGLARFSKVWGVGLQVEYMSKQLPHCGPATELGRDGYMFHCMGCGMEFIDEDLESDEREPLVCEGREGCCVAVHSCCLPVGLEGQEGGERWHCGSCRKWMEKSHEDLVLETQGKGQRARRDLAPRSKWLGG